MMRITILASGSSGNVTLVQAGDTSLLIDVGITAKRIVEHLEGAGMAPDKLAGILLTHEHGDHTRGLKVFAKNHSTPVFTNPLTADHLRRASVEADWRLFACGAAFQIGALEVLPFSVPHDAADPVGFVLRHEGASFAILTDLGYATKQVVNSVQGVKALLIETNHDEAMLQKDNRRPWAVKQRILSRHGHLSNAAAAEVVASIATPDLRHVLLGHISEDCNSAERATDAVRQKLDAAGHTSVEILCADSSDDSPRVSIVIS
jgi:phosphoribosyl 1,2-cyclic phosphodiesterase